MMKPLFFIKRYTVIILTMMFLMTCWEYNLTNSVWAQTTIPDESIRLRILANSDSPRDQWIKRKVRDAVVDHMNAWVQNANNIEEARAEVQARLPDFEQVVEKVLLQYGFSYDYTVELDMVDFPTKMYGNQVYPAGEYEALRVTLGRGDGQNWWCVLFPPLCFVDLATDTAVAVDETEGSMAQSDHSDEPDEPEVRFFLWDFAQKTAGFIKGLFVS